MARSYRRKKIDKVAPALAGPVVELAATEDWLLLWRPARRARKRGVVRTLARPTPQRWANLVLFLRDPAKRKRSYYLAWNGERLAESADAATLAAREPAAWVEVRERLAALDRVVCKAQAAARAAARGRRRTV